MSEVRPRQPKETLKVSPADRIISNLDGTWYKLSEVAQILKISQSTLRRLLKEPGVTAPSMEVAQGKMSIYLYSPKDVEEIRKRITPTIKQRTQ